MSDIYTLPTELADDLLTPAAHCDYIRAMVRGARPKPNASVTMRGGRYVALIDFEEPTSDGTTGLVLGVRRHPER